MITSVRRQGTVATQKGMVSYEGFAFFDGQAFVFSESFATLDFSDSLTQFNYSPTGGEADHAAAWADWDLIARDFRELPVI